MFSFRASANFRFQCVTVSGSGKPLNVFFRPASAPHLSRRRLNEGGTLQRFNVCIRSIPISLTAASRLFRPCRSSQSLHSTLQRPRSDDATPFSSGIARYWVNVCDWCRMPLEPCPACGYALSIVDHHCRHCATASPAIPSRSFNAKHLQQMIIMGVVALSVLVYFIFFR